MKDKHAKGYISKDQHIETSSISTRASSIHSSDISISGASANASADVSMSDHDDSSFEKRRSTASSNDFVFTNDFPSSYNLGGSKIKDDIPARKDLLMSESSKTDLNDSDRLKAYNNSTTMLEEGGLNIVYKEAQDKRDTKGKDKKKVNTPPSEEEDDLSEFLSVHYIPLMQPLYNLNQMRLFVYHLKRMMSLFFIILMNLVGVKLH